MKNKDCILDDREKRYDFICSLLEKYRLPVLCGKLNYPGDDKNTNEAGLAFNVLLDIIIENFKEYIVFQKLLYGYDGEAVILVLDMDFKDAKQMSVKIEESHFLGRIFDLDVYGPDKMPLSRKSLNFIERKCIVCGKDARICIIEKRHSLDDVLKTVNNLITDYFIKEAEKNFYKISDLPMRISSAALCSMLYEVSTSPSPGLVSPCSSGAHNDMDFFTFLKSTSSIAYYMPYFIQTGMESDGNILKKLRELGLEAEKEMLKATNGVNTQRGLLFLLGAACASAGYCIKKRLKLNRFNISKACSLICKDLIKNDLSNINESKKLTNGEKLYLKYGVLGIRKEAENGFETALNYGLPALYDALRFKLCIKDALCNSLINIMTSVEDTTVINRCGMEGLYFMQECAKKAVELKGMKTKEGREYIKYMDEIFIKKNISPGGAADILAVTYFLYELENI